MKHTPMRLLRLPLRVLRLVFLAVAVPVAVVLWIVVVPLAELVGEGVTRVRRRMGGRRPVAESRLVAMTPEAEATTGSEPSARRAS